MSTEDQSPDNPNDRVTDAELQSLCRLKSKADVRRLYAQLLKRCDPETRPDDFQKLRAAYEFALSQASRGIAEVSRPMESPPDAGPGFQSQPARPIPRPGTLSPQSIEADRIWGEFTINPQREHFDRLQALRSDAGNDRRLLLMCYWCARALPSVVPADVVASVVLDGVSEFPGDEQVLALLLEELRRNRSLLAPERAPDIWNRLTSNTDRFQYLTARWRLLCRSGAFAQIQMELPLSRSSFIPQQTAAWAEILFNVLEKTLFTRTPPAESLLRSLQQEIDSLGSILQRFPHRLDSCDTIGFMLDDARNLPVNNSLTGFLCQRPYYDMDDLRGAFFAMVAAWAKQPGQALEQVTIAATTFASGFALLRDYARSVFVPQAESLATDPALAASLKPLFNTVQGLDRPVRRLAIAEIARDECLSFETLQRHMEAWARGTLPLEQMVAETTNDEPLRLVCDSIYAFLAAA